MTNINFSAKFKYANILSLAVFFLSIIFIIFKGLNYGIDFKGGTLIELRSNNTEASSIRDVLKNMNLGDVNVKKFGQKGDYLIKVEQTGDNNKLIPEIKKSLSDNLTSEVNFRRVENVGPKVSAELLQSGIIAISLSLAAMLFYIWVRFEWQFSIGSIIALFHDVIITLGIFSLLSLEINLILKDYIISLMKPLENKSFFTKKDKLNATLISGVNGVGKTTTIGKIGKILKSNGNKVMFAASDTFRAAAIEQLENWANKIDVQVIKSSQGSDPASVAYKAIEDALKNNFDQVLIDTAGRLQNKKNLMEEYKKIANVTKKIDAEAPHDVVLVLDATSGQNIINQVEEFNKIIPITGIIMTKLDGTAKGGILLALAKKYKLPIIALGLGEKEDDLQIFEAEKFADAFTQTD